MLLKWLAILAPLVFSGLLGYYGYHFRSFTIFLMATILVSYGALVLFFFLEKGLGGRN